MKFKFDFKNKKFNIDVEVCKNIFSQGLGLMFKRESRALLFVFGKAGKRAIHSFFCKPFIAVWFNGKKIVDVRVVDSWRFSIKPRKKFDKLLEVPFNRREFYLLKEILVDNAGDSRRK